MLFYVFRNEVFEMRGVVVAFLPYSSCGVVYGLQGKRNHPGVAIRDELVDGGHHILHPLSREDGPRMPVRYSTNVCKAEKDNRDLLFADLPWLAASVTVVCISNKYFKVG